MDYSNLIMRLGIIEDWSSTCIGRPSVWAFVARYYLTHKSGLTVCLTLGKTNYLVLGSVEAPLTRPLKKAIISAHGKVVEDEKARHLRQLQDAINRL